MLDSQWSPIESPESIEGSGVMSLSGPRATSLVQGLQQEGHSYNKIFSLVCTFQGIKYAINMIHKDFRRSLRPLRP